MTAVQLVTAVDPEEPPEGACPEGAWAEESPEGACPEGTCPEEPSDEALLEDELSFEEELPEGFAGGCPEGLDEELPEELLSEGFAGGCPEGLDEELELSVELLAEELSDEVLLVVLLCVEEAAVEMETGSKAPATEAVLKVAVRNKVRITFFFFINFPP